MPSVNQGLKWRAHQSLKSKADSLLCEDTGVHTDCAKSCRLEFYVHVANALCFGFLVLDNVCLLMSKNPLVYKQIFVVNRPFCLFLKFTELTHYVEC